MNQNRISRKTQENPMIISQDKRKLTLHNNEIRKVAQHLKTQIIKINSSQGVNNREIKNYLRMERMVNDNKLKYLYKSEQYHDTGNIFRSTTHMEHRNKKYVFYCRTQESLNNIKKFTVDIENVSTYTNVSITLIESLEGMSGEGSRRISPKITRTRGPAHLSFLKIVHRKQVLFTQCAGSKIKMMDPDI